MNSSWTFEAEDQRWWVVIGWGDTVQTIFPTDKSGLGPEVVTGGRLYDQVQEVNAALMRAEASGSEAPVPQASQRVSSEGMPAPVLPAAAQVLKAVDRPSVQRRPKQFRTYQHLLWFARAVQAEVHLREKMAVLEAAHAATSDPALAAALKDGEARLQRQLHIQQEELKQGARMAIQELTRCRSVLALGETSLTSGRMSAAERAERLPQLLPPYRDLLTQTLVGGIPRHGEKMVEAVTGLVLAVASEWSVALPASRQAGGLADWQQDQIQDEEERQSPANTSRGNGWASSSGNVSRNAWPIRDPRARRFRG